MPVTTVHRDVQLRQEAYSNVTSLTPSLSARRICIINPFTTGLTDFVLSRGEIAVMIETRLVELLMMTILEKPKK